MSVSNFKTPTLTLLFATASFLAQAADQSFTISEPVTDTNNYNNVTITAPAGTPLSSGSVLGGYVYLGGTVDGNITITNANSITSTHSNYGVFYLPNVGNTSSLKTVSVTNSGAMITTGDFATALYIIGEDDGAFPSFVKRSYNFSLDNSGDITSKLRAVSISNGETGAATGSFDITNSGTISISASSAYQALSLFGGATSTISNSGTIQANAASETAIEVNQTTSTITNSGSGSITGIINASGGSSSSLTVTNSSSITGNITTTSSDLNVINNAGTIAGNIILGNNAGSSIAVNGGAITGNVTMNNATQSLTFGGGVLNGTVNGAGAIAVNSNTVTNGAIGGSTSLTSLTVATGITLNAATNDNSIRATNVTLNSGAVLTMGSGALTGTVAGSAANLGTVNMEFDTNSNVTATLGSSTGLAAVNFTANASAQITVTAAIKAAQVTISGIDGAVTLDPAIAITGNVVIGTNSNLLVGNGSSVSGTIRSATEGSGTFQITGSGVFTAAADIGTSSFKLGNITVGDSSTLTTTSALRASTISINSNAILNSSGTIIGDMDINTNGTLNLQDGASFNGSINPGGIVEEGIVTSSGLVTILAEIGGMGAIKAINVGSGSQLRIGNNDSSHANSIEALNINVTGQLDLLDATNIIGTVTMIGSSSKINFSGYSHTITGDFTTVSGSRLYSTIHSSSSIDKLTTIGVATLHSNTKLSLTVGAITPGTSYTLIDGGTGSILNAISNANIDIDGSGTNRLGRYIFSTLVVNDDLILQSVLASLATNNGNQSALYNNIADANAGSSGNLYTMQNYIFGSASDAAKNEALNSAMPQIDNSTNRVLFNTASTSLDLSANRLQTLYAAKASNIKLAANLQKNNPLNKSDFNANNNLFSAPNNYDNSLWSQIFGASINQGNNAAAEGYNAHTRGIAFGFDRQIDKNLYLGISASYANSSAKSHSQLKKTDIDSYQINIYSGHNFEKYFINNLLGFVWNEYKSSRTIPVASTIAQANYSGQNYIARIEGGRNFKLPQNYILTPTIMMTAIHNIVDNYSEDGAGTLNLHTKTASANFFESRAGFTLKNNFMFKETNFAPEIFASYGYDFAGSKQKTSSNFIGQSAVFDATSASLARGSFKTGFATKIFKKEELSFDLNYAFEKRVNYHANSAGLKVSYKF